MKIGMSVKKFILVFIILILGIFIYLITENWVLYSSDAYINSSFIPMAPQIDGRLLHVFVTNNQKVEAGQLLFEIDPEPFQLSLNQDQANLEQSTAQLALTKIQLDNLNLQEAVAIHQWQLSQLTLTRYKNLLAQSATSEQEYDNQEMLEETAKANQINLAGQVLNTAASLKVLAEKIKSEQSAVDLANYDLSLTKVSAPQAGYINNLYIYPGLQVTQNQALFGLVSSQGLQVIANYEEFALSRVKPGQKVWIFLSSDPWHLHHGLVLNFGRAVARDATAPDAALPYVSPTTDWIRYPYRFPITIALTDVKADSPIAMGADARVIIWAL